MIKTEYKILEQGMPLAVAERTILRKVSDISKETWADVAERVALGNALLSPDKTKIDSERQKLQDAIGKATLLLSGRHLQHGDKDQPKRNQEVFTNCSTAPASFLMFYLLLNGSGVGRSYDDDMMLTNWDYAPNLRCVLSDSHPDFDWSRHESSRDAKHKYGNSKDVMWHEVGDSREEWAKALELWENATFEKIHKDKLLILDFSKIRRKGSPIGGMQDRPASGPKELIDAFEKSAKLKGAGLAAWKQAMYVDHYFAECVLVGGARRAARMATKYWRDKNIGDFVMVKRPIELIGKTPEEILEIKKTQNPMGFLWSSNNSVTVDSDFWAYVNGEKNDNKELKAHALNVFNAVCEASYYDGTGEPGLINVDKLTQKDEGYKELLAGNYVGSKKFQVNEDTYLYLSKLAKRARGKEFTQITNPCVTPETLILTKEGHKQIKDFAGQDVEIWNGEEWSVARCEKTGENQKFLRVVLRDGSFLDCTPYHKFYVDLDNWVISFNTERNKESDEVETQAKDLKAGDKVKKYCVNYTNNYQYSSLVEVESVQELDRVGDSYCVNEPKKHRAVFNGIITGQCGEISLTTVGGFCVIADVVPFHADTLDEVEEVFRISTRALIRVNLMDSIYNKEVKRTNRIGVGITGIHEFAWKFFKLGFQDLINEEKSKDFWLALARFNRAVKDEAEKYCKELQVSVPHTLTTIKPAGCLNPNSLVSTNKGLLRLNEIGNTSGSKWQETDSLSAFTDYSSQKIGRFYVNGKVPTIKVVTEDGNFIESSFGHKYRILTKEGDYIWKEACQLEVGDKMLARLDTHPKDTVSKLEKSSYVRHFNGQEMIYPEFLDKDFAWFLGLFYGDGSVHDKGIRISFNRKQSSLIQWLQTFFKEKFNLDTCIDSDTGFYVNSLEFKAFLKENGCLKDFSDSLSLPKLIRTASKENALAFIDGLWRADGGIHNRSTWTICTVTKQFAQDILVLCRSVGFNVKIECAGPGGLGSQDRWIISSRLTNLATKARYISRELRERIWNGLWIDEIQSIEVGESDTYDIEVENEHCYLANSIVSHNTTSKLFMLTEGWHLPSMREFLRWVQFRNEDPLIKEYKDRGYPTQELKSYKGTTIVGFPTAPAITKLGMGDKLVTAAEASPEDQYKWLMLGEKYWIHGTDEKGKPVKEQYGNQISYTLKYKPDVVSFEEFKEMMAKYQSKISCCSVMPQVDASAYEYQPEQPVTSEEYQALIKNIKLTNEDLDFSHVNCANGACPVDFKK